MSDLPAFGVGSIWRKRVAPAAFELRRIESIEGHRVVTSSHVGERTFYDYEFEDLFAPLVHDASTIILAGSGHRPEHIALGRQSLTDIRDKIYYFYVDLLRWLKPKEVISGLARGFDLWFGWAAIEAEVPIIAAIPFPEQAQGWPDEDLRDWRMLREVCTEERMISPAYWKRDGDSALHARNRWMVDRCTHLTSFWQGTRGGTAWTNDYAIKCGKPRLVINSI